ncbi:MAG: biotin--[acetyl-CoA-carboxylase] ligase [Phormidesmis sp. CAN_BIN44]|nr:biotin--[acetyl-CoA-carboxylase] ligase [Phormidesmis sp. CAN_BIN44]
MNDFMSAAIDPLPNWLKCLEVCPSTNTWAIEHLAQLDHGTVIFTRHQTQGRGQNGRVWYSPPGVLTLSVVLDRIPTAQLSGFSLIAGLAVIYAIEDLIPGLQNQLRLKWTNDIWLDDRKLAGILCEGVTSNVCSGTTLVIGIGLNYQADFSNLDIQSVKNPISLHEVIPVVPGEFFLIERLRHYLLQLVGLLQSSIYSSRYSDLLSMVRDRDALLGKQITIELFGEQISGEAIGINDRGRLQLRLFDGTIRTFISGHIIFVE